MSDLRITAEPLEPCRMRLHVVVPEGRLEAAMTEVAQEVGRRLKIRGYRPGHIPLRLVLDQVDEATLRQEARERLTRRVVKEALRDQDLKPAAPVSVRTLAEAPFTLEVVVPLKPRVELGDYRALRVPRPAPEPVEEADIDRVLEEWRKDMTYRAPAERPAAAGDFVTLSLKGVHGDEAIVQAEDLEFALTSEGAMAAGLPAAIIDQLIGVQPGDELSFGVRYPEFWQRSDLQGEEVAFEGRVIAVSTTVQRELDDDLAREVAGAESLAALRERVRSQLGERNELESRDRYLETVLDALVAGSRVEYPPDLLEMETADIIGELRQRVERQGFTWQRWLELSQKDEDALWDEIEPQARRRLERALVLNAFAAAEGIRVDEREVDAEVKRINERLSEQTGQRVALRDAGRRDLAARMHTGRTLDRLVAIAEGTYAEGHPNSAPHASPPEGQGQLDATATEGQQSPTPHARATEGHAKAEPNATGTEGQG